MGPEVGSDGRTVEARGDHRRRLVEIIPSLANFGLALAPEART